MRVLALLLLILMLFTGPSSVGAQEAPATDTDDEEVQEFEPTEQVPADAAISFPVDI